MSHCTSGTFNRMEEYQVDGMEVTRQAAAATAEIGVGVNVDSDAARDHIRSMLRQEERGDYTPSCDYIRRGWGAEPNGQQSQQSPDHASLVRGRDRHGEDGGVRAGAPAAGVAQDAGNNADEPSGIPEEWRLKIAEWTYEAVDHYDLDREVASYALSYVDRAAAEVHARGSSRRPGAGGASLCKTSFQLVAMTALYVAVKVHGSYGPQPPWDGVREGDGTSGAVAVGTCANLDTFVRLGRGMFAPDVIEDTELWLLRTLRWKLHPPTPSSVAGCLLRATLCSQPSPSSSSTSLSTWPPRGAALYQPRQLLSTENEDEARDRRAVAQCLFDLTRYLAEMASCDSVLSLLHRPSAVAAAAAINALAAIKSARAGHLPRGMEETLLAVAADVSFIEPGEAGVIVGAGASHGLNPDSVDVLRARARLEDVCSKSEIRERYPIPMPPAALIVVGMAADPPRVVRVVSPSSSGRKRRYDASSGDGSASSLSSESAEEEAVVVSRYSPNCVTGVP